ncbi:MAG: lysophospholipid acyltransferase family protein [Planctomycetota bacterium]
MTTKPPRRRFRDRHPGSSLGHLVTYEFCRQFAYWFMRTTMRLEALHTERVPLDGSLLLVANHQSFVDPPALGGPVFERHFEFLARATLWKFGPFGKLIASLNSIPITEGGDAAAMKEALARLHAGRAVVVFPEGSRTFDGKTQEFKRGAAVLVKRAKCPVIPAAIEGAFDAWPRTSKRPKLFGPPIAVAYGHPIDHAELMADGPDAALQRLSKEVESLRGELHAHLRSKTKGKYPTSDAPTP